MIRKSLVLLLFVFSFVLSATAQDEKPDYSDTTYWDFGFYISPNYNSRMISGNGSNGVTSAFLGELEIPRIGYTIGGVITRQLGKRLYINTGILFESQGYKTHTLQDTVLNLYDKFLYAKEFRKSVRYYTLQIPVVLRIRLFNAGKVQFNLGVGVAPEFYLNKNVLYVFSDHKQPVNSKAESTVDIQGLVNLNVNIPLSKKLSIGIEPTFRYSILGFKDAVNKGIKRNLYSAGLALQLCYKITDDDFYQYYLHHIYKKPPKTTF